MGVHDTETLVTELDWQRIESELDERGFALTGPLLSQDECTALKKAFAGEAGYRKHVVMQNHGYGQGDYKYYSYPLPDIVAGLRQSLYARLVPTANRWMEHMGKATRFPDEHKAFIDRCHAAGQLRPTPLILKYGKGDYNRLHQDLYGEHVFPLQLAVLLSEPGEDFTGGEFVMTEARARMQSRPHVVPLKAGQGVVFAVNDRPIPSKRGFARVQMRHGVSELTGGERYTFGVIFHDAL
jgi:hypothetical protein